jgi:hypothetical protein
MNKIMNYPKEIYIKDYFDIQNHYSKIYGKLTLVTIH